MRERWNNAAPSQHSTDELDTNREHVTNATFLALSAIVIPTLFLPEEIGHCLNWLHGVVIALFGFWFIWVLAFATILCVVLAAWPKIGKLKLGRADDHPEHSRLSWICMIYGAGLSAALLKWSVAEPMAYLHDNPEVIKGITTVGTMDNFRMAMKWAFLHWGISAWACYAITGLALAFICYRKGKPLSIGCALSPQSAQETSSRFSKTVDVMVILIGMLCLIQILNSAIEYTTSNLSWIVFEYSLTFIDLSAFVLVAVIGIVSALSVFCTLSGPHRGIKWVSITNLALTAVLLLLLLAASSFFGIQVLIICTMDYLKALPHMVIELWFGDNQPTSLPSQLEDWQRNWSLFHWTWWIPFTVFVGLFMARISKGRTVREFVLGAMVVPSLICMIWFSWAGGTAMQLETSGSHAIDLASVPNANKLLAMIQHLFSPDIAIFLYVIVLILIGTYTITTVSSALLVFNSLPNNECETTGHTPSKVVFWGLLMVAASLAVNHFGASSAIQTAMCLSALPVSVLIAWLCKSLVTAVQIEKHEMAPVNMQRSVS